jgi:hypothetical protein
VALTVMARIGLVECFLADGSRLILFAWILSIEWVIPGQRGLPKQADSGEIMVETLLFGNSQSKVHIAAIGQLGIDDSIIRNTNLMN